jgi:hypothetical protein
VQLSGVKSSHIANSSSKPVTSVSTLQRAAKLRLEHEIHYPFCKSFFGQCLLKLAISGERIAVTLHFGVGSEHLQHTLSHVVQGMFAWEGRHFLDTLQTFSFMTHVFREVKELNPVI